MTARSSATHRRARALAFLAAALALGAALLLVLTDDDEPRCAIPDGQEQSETRPSRCPALSDRDAAERVDRTPTEFRPGNRFFNRRTPTRAELREFRARNDYVPRSYRARVTGNFTGTTDDILEWAAWKWGIDENLLRAQALHESDWQMPARGDEGTSLGVMQIKRTFHRGTFPLSASSTAFNLDYYGAVFRYYFDGRARWLGQQERGEPYRSGDAWGSIGAHYAGRWHNRDAKLYIADVRRILRERRWPGA